jgi:TolB-like protein
MSELPVDSPCIEAPVIPAAEPQKTKNKRQKKVRSVWISFAGRIVAQFVGSAATILLGLAVLQQYGKVQNGEAVRSTASQATADAAQVIPVVTDPASLAVLPLRPLVASSESASLSASLTELLTSRLSELPGVSVASATSAAAVAQDRTMPQIARTLRTHYAVEGAVVRTSNSVRLTVRLIDAERDRQVWTGKYERKGSNVLDLQEAIAQAVAADLEDVLHQTEAPLRTRGEPPAPGRVTDALIVRNFR